MKQVNDKSQAHAWLFLCWLISVILIAALLSSCTTKKTPEVHAIPRGAPVLILGDSISYGVGAKHGLHDYPTLLARQTGWQVINAGVPGDVSSGGLARLPSLLNQYHPQLVIVELGGNDFLRHMASSNVEENLKSMVHLVRQSQAQIILIAIPRVSFVGPLADHELYARVAEETGTLLVTDAVSAILSNSQLRSDQIHPNAEGYRQLADAIFKQLQTFGVTH